MEIINLDEIKFNQMARQKLDAYESAVASSGTLVHQNYLTDAERVELNLIMARAFLKFNVSGTDVTDLLEIPRILNDREADILARKELEELHNTRIDRINDEQDKRRERQILRKLKIGEQYKTRVARINTDAERRGMLNSTIVLNQLNVAESARNDAISAIDAEIDFIEATRTSRIDKLVASFEQRLTALSKRLQTDSVRINLATIREKGIQKSRSYRDWSQYERLRLVSPISVQNMINQEIYDRYVIFLSKQSPTRAAALVDHDPLFFFNLPQQLWTRLFNEFNRRVASL